MDIQQLITKYNDKIVLLEQELTDIKHKRDVLQEAFEMLNEEAISGGIIPSANNISAISNKYSNMTWPQALLLALTDKGEMTGEQLLKELLENGFQSKSKSTKSDMYGRLKTLEDKEKIISTKRGKALKRYKIRQEEKKGSDSHMDEPEPKF